MIQNPIAATNTLSRKIRLHRSDSKSFVDLLTLAVMLANLVCPRGPKKDGAPRNRVSFVREMINAITILRAETRSATLR